ncbi:MAG: peptide-methionine (S)-S-oxide reductase MsrA [Candidatus Peribacteraceae bacterium]|nr:peptide-methionine (S)-S-oxide reductase MsrA [Candidatus Peribacteraceae bacterium]MBP9850990.1 peptide-methionine (S)-S-oxide reductase MsrA [Candidatus Peribacteraceae bacterium]
MTNDSLITDTAIFAAGCFWGVEETFRVLPGVISTEVGYTGGHTENPTYEAVCTDTTGHAEALKIVFDPAIISYAELLRVFFANHNPTTKNQQGPDFGSQYRSAIFTIGEGQKNIAEAVKEKEEKSGIWKHPLVTEITEATQFTSAETYHQKYLQKRGLGSCHI